jgi:hypothetical protein
MTARAFAIYIIDKLPHCSDYLVGHAESPIYSSSCKLDEFEKIKIYPEGKEREAINHVFDEIFTEFKLKKFFIHDDRISL